MDNTYCCPMEKRLLTTQYRTRPAGKLMEIHAIKAGMINRSVFWEGSVAVCADIK